MNTFKLIISTPNGNKFDGEAVKLTVRGTEGELAVLAGHIPFVTAVKPCSCFVWKDETNYSEGHIDGGLLTVAKESVTLIAGSFEWTE